MSFQQGLSGLNAASKNLDVIGNNIANTNTVGAKTSRAEFADLYAASLYGTASTSVGIGTQVSAVAQQFTQGDLSATSNPLDVAVNGSGFFRMSQGGTVEYTRNGQFKLDKEGYIVNAQGARLTGYVAGPDGRPATGSPADLRLTMSDIPPRPTDRGVIGMNLDARAQVATVPFDVDNANSYSGATTMSVFDSLGREHSLSLYMRKTAANAWDMYGTVDGTPMSATPVGSLAFDSAGRLTSGSPLTLGVPVGADAGGSQSVRINLDGTTQFGSAFGVTELTQNGAGAGRLAGFSIAQDGMIQARYSNGQFRPQGQIVLANFVNPNGLSPLGGNAWSETSDSGQPLVGAPSSGNLGVLQSGAVENSNVDLTAELVSMITAQRVYQANAQTVRTQDQILQTLVNLR
jgi:flagellar hook protein FlgE